MCPRQVLHLPHPTSSGPNPKIVLTPPVVAFSPAGMKALGVCFVPPGKLPSLQGPVSLQQAEEGLGAAESWACGPRAGGRLPSRSTSSEVSSSCHLVRSEPLPQVGMKGEASGSLAASPIGDPCHDSWALGWSRSARPYGVCGAALPAPNAGVRPRVLRGPCSSGVHPLRLTVPLPSGGAGRGGVAPPAPDAGMHPKGPRDPWAQPTASRELFLKAEHAQLGTWRSPLHLWGLGPLCALPEPSQSTQQLLVGL